MNLYGFNGGIHVVSCVKLPDVPHMWGRDKRAKFTDESVTKLQQNS